MRIRIRILVRLESPKKSEIQPQSCWTSFRRRRKSMTLFSRSSRFFCGLFLSSWIRIRMNTDPIQIRILKSEIQPQSCWTSFRRCRKSMTSLFSRSSHFFVGYFCPPGSGSGSAWIRIQSRSGFETVKFNLSLVKQASDVAGSRWPPCFRGVPASFVGYFCPPGSGSGSG